MPVSQSELQAIQKNISTCSPGSEILKQLNLAELTPDQQFEIISSACFNNIDNIGVLKALRSNGFDLNIKNSEGQNILHDMIHYNVPEIFIPLISNNLVDTTLKGVDGKSTWEAIGLHRSSTREVLESAMFKTLGQKDKFDMLFEACKLLSASKIEYNLKMYDILKTHDLNIQDSDGQTVLAKLVNSNEMDSIRFLTQQNAIDLSQYNISPAKRAAIIDSSDVIKPYLTKGAMDSMSRQEKFDIFMSACRNIHDPEIKQILIDGNFNLDLRDPSVPDEKGDTILHRAISSNLKDAVSFLAKEKLVNLAIVNGKGVLPLYLAKRPNIDSEIAKILFEEGPRRKINFYEFEQLLERAKEDGEKNIKISDLLDKNKYLLNLDNIILDRSKITKSSFDNVDFSGVSCEGLAIIGLHDIVSAITPALFQKFIDNRVDVNYSKDGRSILSLAWVYNKHMVPELIQYGAGNFKEEALLALASSKGALTPKLLGKFISNGVDLNYSDTNGSSILSHALIYNQNMISSLIKSGAGKAKDLWELSGYPRVLTSEMVDIFIQRGVDLNYTNGEGDGKASILDHAIGLNPQVAQTLINGGAHVLCQDLARRAFNGYIKEGVLKLPEKKQETMIPLGEVTHMLHDYVGHDYHQLEGHAQTEMLRAKEPAAKFVGDVAKVEGHSK